MAKRFTDTDKWRDVWFRKLKPTLKLGYGYITDNCDASGVIELDRDLANFQIGMEVEWDELISESEGRIEVLSNGRLWLTKFVRFQYGTLSDKSPPHKKVLSLLEKHGLKKRVRLGLRYPSVTLQEEEEEEEEDKEEEKEEEKEGGSGGKKFTPPTVDEVAEYCHQRGNLVDVQAFIDHYEANGWYRGKTKIKSWRACVRTWEANQRAAVKGKQRFDPAEAFADEPHERTKNGSL